MANQNIKCDVEACKFQNEEENRCTLDEIKVGCDCNSKDVTEKEETVCKSFECDCQDKEKEEEQ